MEAIGPQNTIQVLHNRADAYRRQLNVADNDEAHDTLLKLLRSAERSLGRVKSSDRIIWC